MKQALLIFFFFLPLYVLSMGGHGYGGVGTTTYAVTEAIWRRRTFAITPVPWGKFGRDGQFYAQYGIGHSLYNLPFYGGGRLLIKIFPALAPQAERITMFATLLGQPFISALTCALLLLFCRKLGYSSQTAILCALCYGLGTQAWMYAQLDFSEPILAFFLLGAAYWLYAGNKENSRRNLFCAGLFLGIAITVKVAALILLPVFLGYLYSAPAVDRKARYRYLRAFVAPLFVCGIGVVSLYNAIRFGDPFETGYDNEFNFYYKYVLQQFWNNLLSLEGSIFFYSPVILFGFFGITRFYQRFKAFALFVGGLMLTFLLFYPFTTNELYYGPRYLTPTLPFFMLLAGAWSDMPGTFRSAGHVARRLRAIGIGALLLSGIFHQLLGVVVNYHTYYWRIRYTLPLAAESVRTSLVGQILQATPQLPHLLGHVWLVKQAIRHLWQPGGLPFGGVTLLADATQQNAWLPYYGLDLWWCNPNLHRLLGWKITGAIVAILLSVLSLSLYRLRR